jgi:hypothetical protein
MQHLAVAHPPPPLPLCSPRFELKFNDAKGGGKGGGDGRGGERGEVEQGGEKMEGKRKKRE